MSYLASGIACFIINKHFDLNLLSSFLVKSIILILLDHSDSNLFSVVSVSAYPSCFSALRYVHKISREYPGHTCHLVLVMLATQDMSNFLSLALQTYPLEDHMKLFSK